MSRCPLRSVEMTRKAVTVNAKQTEIKDIGKFPLYSEYNWKWKAMASGGE